MQTSSTEDVHTVLHRNFKSCSLENFIFILVHTPYFYVHTVLHRILNSYEHFSTILPTITDQRNSFSTSGIVRLQE